MVLPLSYTSGHHNVFVQIEDWNDYYIPSWTAGFPNDSSILVRSADQGTAYGQSFHWLTLGFSNGY